MEFSVETKGLTRVFKASRREHSKKQVTALDHVDLKVMEGELFGLLGPNGAGKTTLIKILTTLLLPTSGEAFVLGTNVAKDAGKVRQVINVVSGGEQSGYGILTVRETLWMFSQFYGVPGKESKKRIEVLLSATGLIEKADSKVNKLSTGFRQRMNFARGFVSDPKVIFLDEPTLGLDVTSAREIRAFVKKWVKEKPGRTVLLTTHYMAEADELCDRVAIVDRGKCLSCEAPSVLKAQLLGESVFHLEVNMRPEGLGGLKEIPGVKSFAVSHRETVGRTEIKLVLDNDSVISDVVNLVRNAGLNVITLSKVEPTLEDVFVKLVGRSLEDEVRED